ncbi:MAG: GNAT family N-acetyltransferase [Verrucomicrobia bacterium]|nr:GNAT family N-acetyltransferase [Verrucomicrobiota bacterium]
MRYPSFAGHDITLETERLVLRPFEREDWAVALPYYQDPEFKGGMEENADAVVDINYLERVGEHLAKRGILFAVVEKATARTIGEICLEWMNLTRASVRPGEKVMRSPLGIWDKTLWGRGYGKEMLRCVMRYAFEELGVDRLCAMCVNSNNARSRALFEACGYRLVRELDDTRELDLEVTRDAYAALGDTRPA